MGYFPLVAIAYAAKVYPSWRVAQQYVPPTFVYLALL